MNALTFTGLTDLARAPHSLGPAVPVAHFTTADGRQARSRLDELLTFRDPMLSKVAHWAPHLRAPLLETLARSIVSAPWRDETRASLALSRRFDLHIDDDTPPWHWLGAVHLHHVDLKLIKHILGAAPEHNPAASLERWEQRLDTTIDRKGLLAALEHAGCSIASRLQAPMAAQRDDHALNPYDGLKATARAQVIAILTPLRERYLLAVGRALEAAGQRSHARHVHLGSSGRQLSLLTDDGLFAVLKGDNAAHLHLATAYDAVVPGETAAGPATLARQWHRVVADIRHGDYPFAIHSPIAWGVGRRSR